ncbi:MAG: hypothetical protein ACJ79K_00730 [Gemmatimonadaceae bacterium]
MTGRGRALPPNATIAVAAMMTLGVSAACGTADKSDSPFARHAKPAGYSVDSTRVTALAIHALGDSLPMRVDRMTKGEHGWQVRLLPVRGGTIGGGVVWVDESDSSATVVKRY